MRHLLLGIGSIGKRHYANLRRLRSDDEIITVDINGKADMPYLDFSLIRDSIIYICTPTDLHLSQYTAMALGGARAIFVEKPLCLADQKPFIDFPHRPFVIGYNYHYHPTFRYIKYSLADRLIYLHVYGSEAIHAKYGLTPLETMLSHSIDLSLWINGKSKASKIHDNGAVSIANIRHCSNVTSHLHADMASSFRVATCTVLLKTDDTQVEIDKDDSLIIHGDMERQHWFIEPDDQMYVDEMKAWLNYVETGEAGDLCTFEQAIQVQKIMAGK